MNFHLDPYRPHIDGSTIRCPECGQTYDTILDSWKRLPPVHYPQPTAVRNGEVIVGTEKTWNQLPLCPIDSDMLVAILFRAQVAAEQQQKEQAA